VYMFFLDSKYKEKKNGVSQNNLMQLCWEYIRITSRLNCFSFHPFSSNWGFIYDGMSWIWSIEWLTVAGIPGRILSMQETTQRHVYWFRKYGFPSFWNINWSLGPLIGWQGWMITPELFHCQPKLWYMWCSAICSHPCCRTSTGSFNWSWKFGFWLHA